jgi:hypothetical protein
MISGRVEARFTIPTGGASASVSIGASASAVTVTTAAGNYYHSAAGGVSSWATTLQDALNQNARGYPDNATALSAMLGYGNFSTGAGWLMQDTATPLLAAFGAPSLSAVSTPTYRQAGLYAGKYSVGFTGTSAAFSGGSVFNVTGTDDAVIAWVGYVASAPAGHPAP